MEHLFNTEHETSMLLTKDENEQIFRLLKPNCQSIATTVVQMYSTDGPDGIDWIERYMGILCLVRDMNKRSYFFQLFCPVQDRLVWEHELYHGMQYLAATSFLHTFEAEACIVAFNFAEEKEAAFLQEKVHSINFDPDAGFKIGNYVDMLIGKFVDEVGISKNQLKDKTTPEFMLPPPLPPRILCAQQPAPSSPASVLPPLDVQKTFDQRESTKMVLSPTVLMMLNGICDSTIPPPVPPRIMLPDSIVVPSPSPLPPPNLNSSGACNDSRSALMEAIRRGTTLQPVKANTDKSKADNSRDDLLNEIRKGVKLRTVQLDAKPTHNFVPNNGLAGALARALTERAKVMLISDSSDSSETSDTDGDWDDTSTVCTKC